MNKFSPFLILNFSFLILLASCGRKPAEPPADLGPAPTVSNFVLKNLASEFPAEIRTGAFAGQVQLVLFFRPDDDACRASLPDWSALQADFAGQGFTLVGVLVDDRPADRLAAEVAPLALPFPVGLAADPVVQAFGGPAAIRAIPTAFLLTRDGALARTYPGYEPLAALRDDVVRVLDGQPLPSKTAKSP